MTATISTDSTAVPLAPAHDADAIWRLDVLGWMVAVLCAARIFGVVSPVALALAAHVSVTAWLVANVVARRRVRIGMGLVAVGGLLNMAAMLANGGRMPVSGSPDAVAGARLDARHAVMDSTTSLRMLGDWIDLSVVRTILSPGDILMAIGATLVATLMMLGRQNS